MDRSAVRAFALRERRLVSEAKAQWWASSDRATAQRAAWALWEHARRIRPDWPTEQERANDLAAHVSLKATLDRVGRALASR